MRNRSIAMHFAHSAGQCGASVTADGSVLVTCGADAVVRAHDIRGEVKGKSGAWWSAEKPSEPVVSDMHISEFHEKPINAIAIAPDNNTLATACDGGFVRLFSFSASTGVRGFLTDPDALKSDGNLLACTRFGGAVRALAFSPTGAFLAAAGDEPGLIKLIMVVQPKNVSVLRISSGAGHEAIVDLAFDPLSDFVASVGERGAACIWSVESGSFVTHVNLVGRTAKSIIWSPDGSHLVVGTDKGTVTVLRNSWAIDHVLADSGDDDDDQQVELANGENAVTSVAWCLGGRYLLTGSADARVTAWDLDKSAVLNRWKAEALVQCLLWHPSLNAFILIDEIGQFGIVDDVIPAHLPEPTNITKPSTPSVKAASTPSVAAGKAATTSAKPDANGIGNGSLKETRDEEAKNSETTRDVDDNGFQFAFDAEDVDADEEDPMDRGDILSDTDNSSDDDDQPRRKSKGSRRQSKQISRAGRSDSARVEAIVPFIPSSTPASNLVEKKMRILYWNVVGVMLSIVESTHSVVEVEFSDSSRRSTRIKDHFGYSLGCLSEQGILLGACKSSAHSSLVYFRPYSSWSANSEWTQFLPGDDSPTVLALGSCFAAVSCAPSNIVRIFSLSGIQGDAFGLPGPVLTMTARGNYLAVFYRVQRTSVLRFEVWEISNESELSEMIFRGDVISSEGAKLEWVGFSNNNELCVYDSKGSVSVLNGRRKAKRWIPMVMNKAALGHCDRFWMVAVNDNNLVGVPCHAKERHPPARPRPALRSVALMPPVIQARAVAEKMTTEERSFRARLELNRCLEEREIISSSADADEEDIDDIEDRIGRAEVALDKCTLALMQEACRNEQNLRAYDLSTRLQTKVSFKYAIELAKYFKRTALAERVEQIAEHKMLGNSNGIAAPPVTRTESGSASTSAIGNTEERSANGSNGARVESKKRKMSEIEEPKKKQAPVRNRFQR